MKKLDVVVWRGDPELPLTEQGLTVLGALVGQVEFVQAQLTKKGAEHEALLEMIPQVPNVQVAWLLILFCAGARANFLLRTVQPELTQEFARHHDEQLARCLRRVLHINPVPLEVQVAASMPLTLGGLGGNSERTRDAAHWGSWADCLEMIKIRHPDVAKRIVQGMATRSSRCFQAVEEAASRLRLMGVDTPNWEVLSAGLRPEEGRRVRHRERDPTQPRHGWQKVASAKVHEQLREEVVASFVFLTEGVGEITEWTIGLGAFHVIPDMSSDKNGVRALQSTPFEASEDAFAFAFVCTFLCVWPSS